MIYVLSCLFMWALFTIYFPHRLSHCDISIDQQTKKTLCLEHGSGKTDGCNPLSKAEGWL